LYQIAAIHTQLKRSAKLIGVADEFGVTRDPSPLRITHLDTQFTASPLRVGSPSAKKDKNCQHTTSSGEHCDPSERASKNHWWQTLVLLPNKRLTFDVIQLDEISAAERTQVLVSGIAA
jgi:hypothetical protein